MPTYVLFDGECATCHFVVRRLLRSKRRERFAFAPLSSVKSTPIETQIREQLGIGLTESFVVIKNGELFARAQAAFAVISELGFPWSFLLILRLLPLAFSNFLYNLYAVRRYQIAGKAEPAQICERLPPEAAKRVLLELPQVTLFPQRKDTFLTAEWKNLILVNFAVPPEALEPYLPRGVTLDDWNGLRLVSVVGFSFTGTSFQGIRAPIWSDFEEVNLRFYVKRTVEGAEASQRRGVVFVREIVPFQAVATVANFTYGERYATQPTHSEIQQTENETNIRYSWGKGKAATLSAHVLGKPEPFVPGSLEEFIVEHYFGYARASNGDTTEYAVEHAPWRLWKSPTVSLNGSWRRHYPDTITRHMTQIHSVCVAEGSVVRVTRGQLLTRI